MPIRISQDIRDGLKRIRGLPTWHVSFADWRPGDQLIYVSNIDKAQEILKWHPKLGISAGLDDLWEWIRNQRSLFLNLHGRAKPVGDVCAAGVK